MNSHVKTKDLNALVAKQNGLYEIIDNFPPKVYFDLDVKIDSSRQIHNESYLQKIVDKKLIISEILIYLSRVVNLILNCFIILH